MLWVRVVPVALLTSCLIYFVFLSETGLIRGLRVTQTQQPASVERDGLIPYTVLNRGHAMRDRELTRAREALEYWWSLRQADRGGASGACPLSVSDPPTLSQDEDEPRQVFYQLQAISVLEALGLDNVTTCGGRYPRIIVDIQALREGKDNVYMTANYSTDVTVAPTTPSPPGVSTVTNNKQTDHQISRKFCYTPSYRPFRSGRDEDQKNNTSNVQPTGTSISPEFCPNLLKLYHEIEAGVEPPLLTLFTWIPDPIRDQYRLSRYIMLMNLEMLRPFVRPVLVSDSRQIMAIAHSMGWPCLPIRQFSPDNFPVYQPITLDIMKKFNSTFYGYARATSAFDSSLLETLLAVKRYWLETHKMSNSPEISSQPKSSHTTLVPPPVVLYGSAIYKNNLQQVKAFPELGVQADQRGRTDWTDKESSMVYFLHTKMDVSDVPEMKIEDKYLNPFLVTRSRMKGHVTLDTSRTILCVLNNVMRRRPAWNRVDLPTRPRDEKYNPRLAVSYIRMNNERLAGKNITLQFNKDGNILFQEV